RSYHLPKMVNEILNLSDNMVLLLEHMPLIDSKFRSPFSVDDMIVVTWFVTFGLPAEVSTTTEEFRCASRNASPGSSVSMPPPSSLVNIVMILKPKNGS